MINPPMIKVKEHKVPYSDTVKYLGVTLDKRLEWKSHLSEKVNRAKGLLIKLRGAMGKLWGAPPYLMKWAYTGIVRPMITYGCLVWSKAVETNSMKYRMARLNRLALMSMGHFRRSTPTAGLEVIMNLIPLHLHIQCEASIAMCRTMGQTLYGREALVTNKSFLQGHRLLNRKRLDRLLIKDVVYENTEEKHLWDHHYRLQPCSLIKGNPNRSCDFEVYTDGSVINESAGSGVCVLRNSRVIYSASYYLGRMRSVFQAELYAIFKAAEWLKSQELKNRLIAIHVDSRAALQSLVATVKWTNLIKKTSGLLNDIGMKNNVVHLRWVKAHVGHIGNELADDLAKKGSMDPLLQGHDIPDKSKALLFTQIRQGFKNAWKKEWENRQDCRQTKQWFPTIDATASASLLGQNRAVLSRMVQLLTGHSFLRDHQAKMVKSTELECRLCLEEDETSFHIIALCPALAKQRLHSLGTLFLEPPPKMVSRGYSIPSEYHE